MTDEEKKAFESVKDMFSDVTIKDIDEQSITIYGVAMLDVIKVLTIVEKQSKEIEELKDTRSIFNMGRRSYKNEIEDKIKAEIEEYEEKIKKIKEKAVWEEPYDTEKYVRYTNYIYALQSLLKE